MHPMTIYETAVREHDRATAQRARTHVHALRRRESGDQRAAPQGPGGSTPTGGAAARRTRRLPR
jgi:hypothetical protein